MKMTRSALGVVAPVEALPEKMDMPPFLYGLAHQGAKLSDANRAALIGWARGLATTRGR